MNHAAPVLLLLLSAIAACGGASEGDTGGGAGASAGQGGAAGGGGSTGKGGAGGSVSGAGGSVGGSVSGAGGSVGGSASGAGGGGGSGGAIPNPDPRCPPTVPSGMCSTEDNGLRCAYSFGGCLCYMGEFAPGSCQVVDLQCTGSTPPPAEGMGGFSTKIGLPPQRVCACSVGQWSCPF